MTIIIVPIEDWYIRFKNFVVCVAVCQFLTKILKKKQETTYGFVLRRQEKIEISRIICIFYYSLGDR